MILSEQSSNEDEVNMTNPDDPNQLETQQIQLTTQQNLSLPQQQTQEQTPLVGMFGTIPVVKIQGGTLHFVKEKKGRFKLLQESLPGLNIIDGTTTQAVVS